MIRFSIFIFLWVVLQGCAVLGSKAVVLNKPSKKIERVAVILASYTTSDTLYAAAENLHLTMSLGQALARKNLFRFTIMDEVYPVENISSHEKSLLATELQEQFDAYMICLAVPKGSDYRIELIIVQTDPMQELIKIRHNTKAGNSYWWPQGSAETLTDATESVVDKLESEWYSLVN